MGKLIKITLLFLLGMGILFPANASANTVVSLTGGKYVEQRALVPMRAIFEQLGAQVEYDSYYKSITATRGDKEIILFLWSNYTYINGIESYIDVPAQIDNDTSRTLVPLRFVSESLGATVQWDQKSSTASVYSDNKKINVKVNAKSKFDNDINIHYSIDAYGNIHSNYYDNYSFSLVSGQKVKLIQSSGSSRTLLSGMSLDFGKVKPNHIELNASGYYGETEVTIIPNHYDWELAYYYYFYR
ncbi:copper amine oxidase N-terminal domain-containing protein [Bacillus sp. ISL-47]|uniref:copper amine oxidase N-terminal domain-containing protein n=1 Tax=Bacillus sp. ISL-47 TaxID=2819130 RepID=UPI001BE972DE|nr:copper amine oxidase N-terminal domain-containing protein [Bacillus sp. ISL-47]MBT2687434.1 copper amine oxidase N-terminal domain-containing protein [Bacillus sp. ISL-47]MBT2707104.1 copper amine oxidase N-terminal domain-containing protein [Pseudomonas sp. ISL-84]